MDNIKITTESGSTYEIKHGICKKFDKEGYWLDSFKLLTLKPILVEDSEIKSWADLRALPDGEPQIGLRIYIGGFDSWWISTRVVSIESLEENND